MTGFFKRRKQVQQVQQNQEVKKQEPTYPPVVVPSSFYATGMLTEPYVPTSCFSSPKRAFEVAPLTFSGTMPANTTPLPPIVFQQTDKPVALQYRGCRSEGYCPRCRVIVRDYTCFCAGVCPRCKGHCPDVPKDLEGYQDIIYTSGDKKSAYYENGAPVGILTQEKPKPLKLHLGCYHKKIHGFLNVDIRPEVQPDLVDDVFTLYKVKNNSADLIYACHVLEHGDASQAKLALQRWYEVLKSGGTVRIAVPDLEAVMKYYLSHGNLKELRSFIWGSQKHKYDNHYTGWDFETLKSELETVGFKNVRRYDWRQTEHFFIDDYSQSYMPQISYKSRRPEDRIEGTLMSLNIEATK